MGNEDWKACHNCLWHVKWETIMCDLRPQEMAIWLAASEERPRDPFAHVFPLLFRAINLCQVFGQQWFFFFFPHLTSSCYLWSCAEAWGKPRRQHEWILWLVLVCVCVCVCLQFLFSAKLCSTTWFDLVMEHWWVFGGNRKWLAKLCSQDTPVWRFQDMKLQNDGRDIRDLYWCLLMVLWKNCLDGIKCIFHWIWHNS